MDLRKFPKKSKQKLLIMNDFLTLILVGPHKRIFFGVPSSLHLGNTRRALRAVVTRRTKLDVSF